jgi:20S proteasome alpha/beta subunit
MTVCIGVLAAESKAIVCVADRYITYRDDIAGDTDSAKILPLGDNGTHAMIAGADTSIGRVLAKLVLRDDLGKSKEDTQTYCEEAYREAEREILERRYLGPFLSSDEYKRALLKKRVNSVIRSISRKIDKDREWDTELPTFSCSFVLCGFDQQKHPYLLSLESPGICTDMTLSGFCSIGSGSSYALQRLLETGWERKFPIDRALYEVFDAKIQAENDPNVGYDSDVIVLTADKSVPMPEDTKTMLDRAWIKLNRSPYVKFDRDEHVPLPPKDWMKKLKDFAESILPNP